MVESICFFLEFKEWICMIFKSNCALQANILSKNGRVDIDFKGI